MQEKQKVRLGLILRLGGILLALWLFGRLILGWAAPFLLAALLAAAIEPAVAALERCRWPRSLASGLCTLLLAALFLLGLGFLALRAGTRLAGLRDGLPLLANHLAGLLEQMRARLEFLLSGTRGAGALVEKFTGALVTALGTLPSMLSEKMLAWLSGVAAGAPDALLFAVTAGVGTYFISASRPGLSQWIQSRFSAARRARIALVWADLKIALMSWLRAQFFMSCINFGVLLLAFTFLRVRGALSLAVLTALVDAFPILGTGTVLIPWALGALLSGRRTLAAGLAVTYGCTLLLRRSLEAKLMSDQMGLHPLAALLAVYVGFRIWGFAGMLAAPVVAIMLQRLSERGVIELWKIEEKDSGTDSAGPPQVS